MGKILNEIFANFEQFENEIKEANEQSVIDKSQFGLLNPEEDLAYRPASLLSNSIILTAEDKDVLSEKQLPFGLEREDLVEVAHPDTVQVADGPHTSGVVENQNQQHRKIVEMVNKMPTGNVFHDMKLASLVSAVTELTSIANDLDKKGLYSEADLLTEAISELADLKKKRLNKTALPIFLAPFIPMLVQGLIGAFVLAGTTATTVAVLNGITEGFEKDLRDLQEALTSKKKDDISMVAISHVDNMLQIVNYLLEQSNFIDRSVVEKDSENIVKGLANVDAQIYALKPLGKAFLDSDPSKMPDEIKSFQSSIIDRIDNVIESWEDGKKSLIGLSKMKPLPTSETSDVERAKALPGTTNKSTEPNTQKAPQSSAPNTQKAPQSSAPSDSERVKGIQTFLNRIPYEVTGLDHDLEVNGKLDEDTIFVLDNFAEHIANDLGLGNLTGVRLQREADSEKLRQIWDVYKNPWRYQD